MAVGLGALLAAMGAATFGVTLGTARADAAQSGPTAGVVEDCQAVFGPSAIAGVPAEGSVHPGAAMSVDVNWTRSDTNGAPVDVLACTTLDGAVVPEASTRVAGSADGGRFAHRFTVPAGAPAGATLCEGGAVLGAPGAPSPLTRVPAECLTVAGGSTRVALAAAPAPPASPVSMPPVPAQIPAAPAPPGTGPIPAATVVPPMARSAASVETLPHTGTGSRAFTAAAGLLLVAGGLAVAAGRRKPSVG